MTLRKWFVKGTAEKVGKITKYPLCGKKTAAETMKYSTQKSRQAAGLVQARRKDNKNWDCATLHNGEMFPI